jgi:purine-nucleoside/S-methyl-5'-thioadenosine phosphorylase / adenosine deaminase
MIALSLLSEEDGVRHAFFTREGGVSRGLFAELNCGILSGDAPEKVAQNRAIAMARLSLASAALVTSRQVHGRDALAVERPWRSLEAPLADGLVTRVPGLALAVLTADCAPVLFVDAEARVVGAAHAGWRGAKGGILEATIARMEGIGAVRGRIRAGIGPSIAQPSYEVGAEFRQSFLAEDSENDDFFTPARHPAHFLFDLPRYIEKRLEKAGISRIARAGCDTASEEARFFSCRRAALRGEPAYGRLLSAILLRG